MLFADRAEIGMVLGTALAGPMSTRGGASKWEGRAIDSRPLSVRESGWPAKCNYKRQIRSASHPDGVLSAVENDPMIQISGSGRYCVRLDWTDDLHCHHNKELGCRKVLVCLVME